jgi:DUF2934 family protein
MAISKGKDDGDLKERSSAASKEGVGNGFQPPTHDEIALVAYDIYVDRGGAAGGEVDDWLEAEKRLWERARSQTLKSKSTTA